MKLSPTELQAQKIACRNLRVLLKTCKREDLELIIFNTYLQVPANYKGAVLYQIKKEIDSLKRAPSML